MGIKHAACCRWQTTRGTPLAGCVGCGVCVWVLECGLVARVSLSMHPLARCGSPAGTGAIGVEACRILKGIGCNVLAYDIRPNPKVRMCLLRAQAHTTMHLT